VTRRNDIVEDLQERLEALEDLEAVVLFDREPPDVTARPCVALTWTSDRLTAGPANGRFTRFLRVAIYLFAVEAEGETLLETIDRLLAEIEAVVMADHTFGGNAFDVRDVESSLFPAVEGIGDVGGIVTAEIGYYSIGLGAT
jgi:hypothetical protein